MTILFNNQIGYNGQDIHIWRNGKPFPLHEFFTQDSGADLVFKYELNLSIDPNDPTKEI